MFFGSLFAFSPPYTNYGNITFHFHSQIILFILLKLWCIPLTHSQYTITASFTWAFPIYRSMYKFSARTIFPIHNYNSTIGSSSYSKSVLPHPHLKASTFKTFHHSFPSRAFSKLFFFLYHLLFAFCYGAFMPRISSSSLYILPSPFIFQSFLTIYFFLDYLILYVDLCWLALALSLPFASMLSLSHTHHKKHIVGPNTSLKCFQSVQSTTGEEWQITSSTNTCHSTMTKIKQNLATTSSKTV